MCNKYFNIVVGFSMWKYFFTYCWVVLLIAMYHIFSDDHISVWKNIFCKVTSIYRCKNKKKKKYLHCLWIVLLNVFSSILPRTTSLNKRSEKEQVNSFLLFLHFGKSRLRRQTVASLFVSWLVIGGASARFKPSAAEAWQVWPKPLTTRVWQEPLCSLRTIGVRGGGSNQTPTHPLRTPLHL